MLRSVLRDGNKKKKLLKKARQVLDKKELRRRKVLKEKENKKKKILKAATELFAKKGFQNTMVSDITRKAKVAKGTFYSYFDKKEDVLLYFLDSEIEHSNEIIKREIVTQPDFLSQIELLISIYLKYIFHNKDFGEILIADRFMKMGTKDNKNELKLIQSLMMFINLAKEKNEVKNDVDIKALAEIIFAINTMYIIYWLNKTIKTKSECIARIKKAVGIILNGVGTTESIVQTF